MKLDAPKFKINEAESNPIKKVSIFDALRQLAKEDISVSLTQEEADLFKMAYQKEVKDRETQFILGGRDKRAIRVSNGWRKYNGIMSGQGKGIEQKPNRVNPVSLDNFTIRQYETCYQYDRSDVFDDHCYMFAAQPQGVCKLWKTK